MAPKIRELQKSKETLSSFENWRGNLTYNLTLNPNFAEFLYEDCIWKKSQSTGTENSMTLLRQTMKVK